VTILGAYWLRVDNSGTFTLLAYTNESEDVAVPSTWGDADPHLIDRGKVEQVRLRSFSTNVHSLEVSLGLTAIVPRSYEARADCTGYGRLPSGRVMDELVRISNDCTLCCINARH
jgi:hypothetical protein